MQYFGGKAKIGNKIAEIINSYATNGIRYIEPFVGGGWVASQIKIINSMCYDINPYLIAMYNDLKNGWKPPKELTKEQYQYIKIHKDENRALTGFVGFGCSFAGKWFGGFASSPNRNYCLNAYNSVMKKLPELKYKQFECIDYQELKPENCLIYCDPPYAGTTQYDFCPNFDSDKFWQIMREWSKNNTVIISEYKAPEDFKIYAEFETKTDIRNAKNLKEKRIERLFIKDNNDQAK